MKNEYHHDLMEILAKAGSNGLQVRFIALQIYNRRTGLFCDTIDFNKLYDSIRFYLWSQSRRPSSPFMHGAAKGFYRLKPAMYQQMLLPFAEEETKKEETADSSALPLPCLFDDFE